MYPILCPAGYGIPLKGGKMEIIHITAAASDTNATARLTLLDDSNITGKWGSLVASKDKNHYQILDLKRVAVCEPNIRFEPIESIKTRYGISILHATNLVPGSINIYVR